MIRCVVLTAVAGLVLAVAGGLGFLYSGLYNVAASEPHFAVVRWALTTLQDRSVARHAAEIEAPPLHDAALVRQGFALYEQHCVVCHGAPGVGPALLGRGINPKPPPLTEAAGIWTDAELYWIVRHGIRMAGMPSFETGLGETELWALVAFLRRLDHLELPEYAAMRAAAAGRLPADRIRWVDTTDQGWARLRAAGDPEAGKALIRRYGCGGCHAIPGIPGATGGVGPPLAGWAARRYIAGAVLNQPDNLVAWIADPQRIEPGTAMPDLDVPPAEALHIAAYLYSLH